MLPTLLRRPVIAIFGRIGGSRFRNAVAPVSSFHLHNSVGERDNEQRWYSAATAMEVPPKMKSLIFGNQDASTERPPFETYEKHSYLDFLWNNFLKYLKVDEDRETYERIAALLTFFSSQSDDDMISLDDYVDNMLPDQKDIFYIKSADSVLSANNFITPFLKRLHENNIEVLFLAHPIDDLVIQKLKSYKDKNFFDASKEEHCLDLVEEKGREILKQKFGSTCEYIKKHLGDKVASVEISMKRRLDRPPCVMVTGRPFGWSAAMERLMKKPDTVGPAELFRSRRVFEINPQHPIIRRLNDALEDKLDEKYVHKLIDLLHTSVLFALGLGGVNTDPAKYAQTERELDDLISDIKEFI